MGGELGCGAFDWVGAWWGLVWSPCRWAWSSWRWLLSMLLDAVGKGLVGVLPVVGGRVPHGFGLALALFALAFALFTLGFAFAFAFAFAFVPVVVVGGPLFLPLFLLLWVVVEDVLPPHGVCLEFFKCLWEGHAFVPMFVQYVIEA